jgi:hypothetical protein
MEHRKNHKIRAYLHGPTMIVYDNILEYRYRDLELKIAIAKALSL